MIHTLHLRQLKAWRDSGPVRLAPVTMLLGTNSSGKSTLMQSLLLLKQTVATPDRTVHLNLGGDGADDLVQLGGFTNLLTHGVAAPRQFDIAFEFERPEHERLRQGRFFCRYGQTAQGAVVVQELELSTVARRFRAVRRERGSYAVFVDDEAQPRGKGPQLAPERSIALPAPAIALLGDDGPHAQDLSLAIRRELEGLVYLGPLRRRPARDHAWNPTPRGDLGSDGHRLVDALLTSALHRSEARGATLQQISRWLQRMNLGDRLTVQRVGRTQRYEVLIHQDGVAANLHDVGMGVAQVLPVLAVAHLAPAGSTVLLEEPELHLHPLAQAVLAELFAELSQQRQVQFIVETHSEHMFRRMQTLMARGQTRPAQCHMLFAEREGADAVLVPLDVDDFGVVRNWPPRFFGDAVGEAREQARARAQRMREAAGG